MIKIQISNDIVEIDENSRICYNCRYSELRSDDKEKVEHYYCWQCRRHAPHGGYGSPSVCYDFWCGEFEPKHKELVFGKTGKTSIPEELTEQQKKLHDTLMEKFGKIDKDTKRGGITYRVQISSSGERTQIFEDDKSEENK